MSDIMHIGMSALMAYQSALNIASQNIANADTPFYSRRAVEFTEGLFNSGVNIADVRRIFDETANRYVQTTNSEFSKWNVYLEQLSNFEPLLDDDKTSVGKFITDSLGALRQIQSSFSPSNRSLYMSKLASLAQQFQNVNSEINRQLENVNSSLQTEVGQVNNLINGIANINGQLAASGDARPELLDQRESLLQQLSTYINFNRIENEDGRVDITLSNGMSLLQSNPPLNFTTVNDPGNANHLLVAIQTSTQTIDVTKLIQGGEIAGWIGYRQNGLSNAQIALGRLALVMSESLNAQNRLGVDANGNLGGNLFADINSTSMMSQRVIANANNTGSSSMSVHIDDVSQILPNDYKLSIGAGNTYVLTRLDNSNTIVSSGTLSAPPTSITVDGFTVNIASGTFNNGDQYVLSTTKNASSNMNLVINDPAQLALGWPVTASEGIKSPGGDGTISVTNIVDTTNAAFATPYQLDPPIRIEFSVSGGITQYSIINANTSVVIEGPINYTTGANIFPTPGSYDPGYRVVISGNNIQDGDTFNIQYNSNVTSDNRNAIAMAQLYENGTVQGASGLKINFRAGYDMISSDISVKTNDANARFTTSNEVKNKALQRRDAISGVALEEETLNLSQFQTAYQASAQVLQTAKTVFEIIVSISRG